MAKTTRYPTEFPQESAKLLYDMLTGRKTAELSAALHAGWEIQGFAQGLAFPVNEPVGAKSLLRDRRTNKKVKRVKDDEALVILGALANKRPDKSHAIAVYGTVNGKAFRGQALRDQLLRLFLPVLVRWMEKWVEGGGLQRLIDRIVNS